MNNLTESNIPANSSGTEPEEGGSIAENESLSPTTDAPDSAAGEQSTDKKSEELPDITAGSIFSLSRPRDAIGAHSQLV